MKTKITLLLMLMNLQMVLMAQSDDRFYYPQKEWSPIPDSLSYEEINITTEEHTLNAALFKPAKPSNRIIFFLHGAGGNITTYLPMTTPMLSRGLTVFMIDMPGYGKSTGTPTHKSIEKEVVKAFDYMLQLAAFQNKKIIVYGASMGTQAAAVLGRERADKIDLLILEGGMSSFTDIAVASAPPEQKMMIAQFLVSPYSSKEIVKTTAGLKKWIIHSKEDSAVPYEQAIEVYENAAEPKYFWTFEGDHLEANQLHPDDFLKKLNELLSE